jgi:CDP-glucose 4,6-dehydratase
VIEMVDMILGVMDRRDLKPRILNEASHEIPKQFLDCTRARGTLGWKPAHSMEDGLRETIAWYRERMNA